ncbi:DNA damage-inducible protein 1-like protein [Tanacetum coccineum]
MLIPSPQFDQCYQNVFQGKNNSQKNQLQTVIEIGIPNSQEPKQTLEDEFKDLHLNLPVLEVLAHDLMYNAILDKYVKSLVLGKNGSAFIQGEMPEKMKDPGLFTLPCRLGDSKPFNTLADLGSCLNLIPLYLFKKLKIRLLEEIGHVFELADGTKSYPIGIVKNVEVHIERLKLLDDFYVIDMEKDPATPLLVRRGFLATANAVIDYRKAKITVGGWVEEISLGAIPINLKGNKWESEELIKKKIDWNKPPKEEMHLDDFGGNTHDLGSFGEEPDKTMTLHQISWKNTHTMCGDGVAIPGDDIKSYKRRRQDSQDGV